MDIYYTKTHEWVKVKDDESEAIVGISRYAADELGDVNYVDLPKVDTDIILGDSVCTLEAVNSSSEVFTPISGTVLAVNTNLEDDPGLIAREPENRGWLYKVENIDTDEFAELMTADEYKEYLQTI